MYTPQAAEQISKKLFGHTGTAVRLAGESDFNFQIKTNHGGEFLLKISNEKLSILHIQNAVLQWLQASRPDFNFPVLQAALTGEYIAHLENNTVARLFTYVPGKLLADVANPTLQTWQSLGTQLAHLTQSLQHFKHTHAKRDLRWDLQQALWIKDELDVISNSADKELIQYFLQKFESDVMPVLPLLRHSVIHGDINDYNIVVTDHRVTGFIDFGDVVETATICELAIALTYAMLNQDDPLTCAAHIIKAYHAVLPLEENEINILFALICMRLCVSVVNSAMKKKVKPHDAYVTVSEKPAWELLKKFREMDANAVTALFHQACYSSQNKEAILATRKKHMGGNVKLAYDNPLLIVRGKGQYLYDENGRQYLDCVNNVAHVGHCHEKVVAAGQKQMAVLNTNTRYLHDSLTRYAERLAATLPSPLDVCFFVCTGSEANELALRLAEAHTGRKHIVVMDHAYHGNTSKLINISPYKFNGKGGKGKPDFVTVLPLPDAQQQRYEFNFPKDETAAFISESMLSCGGQIVLPPHYMQQAYAAIRKAGGVCIADEIQVGLGRVGTHFWGFQTQNVIPDIVTLGKPLGNGHPLAAVITTKEIADSFCNGMEYFNTFGGNPVSCAIGLAVLDVIEEEKLQQHALHTGEYLKQQLLLLKEKHTTIKDVRGLGLFLGVELQSPDTQLPAHDYATHIVNQMKERGILLSTDGPLQNVLKIKPPLVFTKSDGDSLVSKLDEVLNEA